jgi:hypothetical protein
LMVNFNRTDILCIQKPNFCSHFTHCGILGFLTIFKYRKSQNDRISASFAWFVTKRLLRPVNLEMVQWSLLSGWPSYFCESLCFISSLASVTVRQ